MSDKYNRVMDKIQVTDEMQNRILQNIEHENSKEKSRMIHFERIAKILVPAAACIALVFGLFHIWSPSNDIPPTIQTANPISQVSSIQELSNLLGFDVLEIEDTPFSVCEVIYTSYNAQLAEIKYIGENSFCMFRQAKGSEDISGDYTNYIYETQSIIGEKNVFLRGESSDSLISAIWTDDEYSYSLEFSDGMSLDIVEQTILSITSSID